jgi:hypothetical protein
LILGSFLAIIGPNSGEEDLKLVEKQEIVFLVLPQEKIKKGLEIKRLERGN